MVRTNRRGWSALPLRLFAGLGLLALTATSAAEPDGDFRLRLERLPSADGAIVVRLKLRPFADLDEAALTVAAALEFELRSRTPSMHTALEPHPVPRGTTELGARLRGLDPASPSAIDFELSLPPRTYGTIEFVVEGRDDKGRALRDAVGLLVPDPAGAGVRRLGAVEFPAVVLQNESSR